MAFRSSGGSVDGREILSHFRLATGSFGITKRLRLRGDEKGTLPILRHEPLAPAGVDPVKRHIFEINHVLIESLPIHKAGHVPM